MMPEAKSCPEQSSLQALLAGQLAETEHAAIVGHVETCAACQQVLESLSPASQSWEDVAAQLERENSPPPVALREVIERAKSSALAGEADQTQADEKSTPHEEAPRGDETQAEARL